MKKILLVATACFLFIFMISCEDEEECKECKIVTYDANGDFESEGTPEEYCGEYLIEIENMAADIDSSGIKSEYVCV